MAADGARTPLDLARIRHAMSNGDYELAATALLAELEHARAECLTKEALRQLAEAEQEVSK